MPPVPVEVSMVVRTTVTDRFEAVGSTQAGDEVLVATEIQGVVAALPFQEGSWVTKGQVLAQLDDSELAADMARAEAVRDQARTTYERWKNVVDQKAGAQQDVDDALSRYKIAEAELTVAQVRLSKTRITAPFSGNAGARRVSVGAFLNPGDPIVMLAGTEEIRVTFSAPERFVPLLRRGSSVAIGVTAYPGEQWFGRIDVVDPVLSEATRSVQILARVPNPDGRLRPGMSASVSAVLAERPDSVTMPSEAVFAEGDQFFAFIVNPDSTVARVQLSLGSRTPIAVEILNEIEPGTMVVKAGHQKLFPGARVMPMPSQEAPAAEHPVTGTETPAQAPNAPDSSAQTSPTSSQTATPTEAKDDTP